MVRERDRLALELWAGDAGDGDRSRRDEFESGFVSLIRNQTSKDQLRLNAQYRQDYFQVPFDPDANDYECSFGLLLLLRAARWTEGARRVCDRNWVHTISPKALIFRRAVLSLQPVELRFGAPTTIRLRRPGTRLRTTSARRRMRTSMLGRTASRAGCTRFTRRRTIFSACR